MLPTFNKNPEHVSLKKAHQSHWMVMSAATHATGGSKYSTAGATVRNDSRRRNCDSSVRTVTRVWAEQPRKSPLQMVQIGF